MKDRTLSERWALSDKLANYYLVFMLASLLVAVIGGSLGYISLLILTGVLAAVGIVFFVAATEFGRYYPPKPKWQREVERKMQG